VPAEIYACAELLKSYALLNSWGNSWVFNGLKLNSHEPDKVTGPNLPFTEKEQEEMVKSTNKENLKLKMKNESLVERLTERRKEVKHLQKCLRLKNLITASHISKINKEK
jgi:hypothetical protein